MHAYYPILPPKHGTVFDLSTRATNRKTKSPADPSAWRALARESPVAVVSDPDALELHALIASSHTPLGQGKYRRRRHYTVVYDMQQGNVALCGCCDVFSENPCQTLARHRPRPVTGREGSIGARHALQFVMVVFMSVF